MKGVIEEFIYNGSEILELKEPYINDTVKGYIEDNSNKLPIILEEIGDRYINISSPMVEGTKIIIQYNIESISSKNDSLKRIKDLEDRLEKNERVVKEILKALKYRVDLGTFNTWVKSIEGKLGIELVSQSFQTPYP